MTLEEALHLSEDKVRALITYARTIFGIVQGRHFVYANPLMEELTGYTHEEFLSVDISELIAPDFQEMVLDRARRRVAGEEVPNQYEFVIVAKDGKKKWIRFTGGIVEYGGKPAIVASGFDITDRKEIEEAGAERQKNLEIVSRTGMKFLEVMSPEEIFTYLAEQLRQVAGDAVIAVSEYVMDSNQSIVRALVGPEDKLDHMRSAFGRDPVGLGFTVSADAREEMNKGGINLLKGGIHELTFGQVPLPISRDLEKRVGAGGIYVMAFIVGKDLLGTVAILANRSGGLKNKDIKELLINQAGLALKRQRAEAGLIRADRDKNNFLTILAHELRNPLAPIVASTSLLKFVLEETKETIQNPTVAESLDVIQRQTSNMKRLLDELLDISRIIRGKIILRKEMLDLRDILQQAIISVEPLMLSMRHELSVSVPEGIYIEGDAIRIEQVVVNLLNNAAKYTDPGGTIRLELVREKNQAVIRVSDTGIGIEKEMIEHIFNLFSQADITTSRVRGGLGIGLTLVNNIVSMHGGSVEAASAGLGKGSIFTVRLPLVPNGTVKPSAAIPMPVEIADLKRRRVLIVDDNRDVGLVLTKLLAKLGQDVKYAGSAPEALKISKEWRPQLYLLDIGMPDMDGYELARLIRASEHADEMLLVAVTGYGQEEDRQRAMKAGYDFHLVKPIGIKDIMTFLKK